MTHDCGYRSTLVDSVRVLTDEVTPDRPVHPTDEVLSSITVVLDMWPLNGLGQPMNIKQFVANHRAWTEHAQNEAERLRAQREAALALADKAEKAALRWADPLPVPEWVGQLREALES